ncbi:hypothetical protein [uncultured Croceicoccus sp.]|uniref:hypothetical protein n=1 Tax=uncultured Croceicoccus sp. TaxID=1295329 RepID=UPI002601804B|nr:hypothetical protein [uncultured Croceicoccus sp.]
MAGIVNLEHVMLMPADAPSSAVEPARNLFGNRHAFSQRTNPLDGFGESDRSLMEWDEKKARRFETGRAVKFGRGCLKGSFFVHRSTHLRNRKINKRLCNLRN